MTKFLLYNTFAASSKKRFCNKVGLVFKSFQKAYNQTKMYSSSGKEQKADVGGININYLKVGSGPHTVLCLPGAMGSIWTDFKPQVEGLDKSKLTVIAWDPPGYGRSIPPEREFPLDFLHRDADTAAKLMQVLNVEKYSLLGWSDGGITALILAAKHRQNVQKLAVWGANAYVTAEDVKIYQSIRDVSRWSEKMRAPLIALYGEEYFKRTWEAWVDTFPRLLEAGGDLCKSLLPDVACPTFILHGAKDPVVPGEHPKYLAENIKGSRVHVFEKGKHNIHIRYAAEFNKLVEDFISS